MDMRLINPGVIEEYRRTGGVLDGDLSGLPVLLLTATGRRSGAPHTTPLGYIRDGDRVVVAASAGGSPADPDWYRNLVAEPRATIEIGTTTQAVSATLAHGTERDRLFEQLATTLPGMRGYAAAVEREIPVIVLTPSPSDD